MQTKTTKKPTSIDDYLATVPPDRRDALEKLRAQILAIAPDVEECISYAMPAFRVEAGVLAGFLATTKGCSYYPFSGRTLKTLATALTKYDGTSGALHFDPKRGLPATLVRKLLATRRAELVAKQPKAKPKVKPKTKPARVSR